MFHFSINMASATVTDAQIADYFNNCTRANGPSDKRYLAFYGHKKNALDAYLSNFAPTGFHDDKNKYYFTAEQ